MGRRGSLGSYFTAVGAKRLTAVEANPHRSNQHELNGVAVLRMVFGDERTTFHGVRFLYWPENGDPVTAEGFLTWYDARETHPTRSEYRLYFERTAVSNAMAQGDLALFARTADGAVLMVVCEGSSTAENQLRWLFGIGPLESGTDARQITDAHRLGYVERRILAEIGVEVEEEDAELLNMMVGRWGGKFPTSRVFSDFARITAGEQDSIGSPDEAVLKWLEQEETLFRILEKHIVGERLRQGFAEVESFISFSLTVQNRRKSRAGLAVENHLEAVFKRCGVLYTRGGRTENRSRPDFLFPSIEAYHRADYPAEGLTMLGAKSSLKDRWRQVLTEAARIHEKHLFTVEAGISQNQTSEMQSQNLRLVVPVPLFNTFANRQQEWLMSLADFLKLVRTRSDRYSHT